MSKNVGIWRGLGSSTCFLQRARTALGTLVHTMSSPSSAIISALPPLRSSEGPHTFKRRNVSCAVRHRMGASTSALSPSDDALTAGSPIGLPFHALPRSHPRIPAQNSFHPACPRKPFRPIDPPIGRRLDEPRVPAPLRGRPKVEMAILTLSCYTQRQSLLAPSPNPSYGAGVLLGRGWPGSFPLPGEFPLDRDLMPPCRSGEGVPQVLIEAPGRATNTHKTQLQTQYSRLSSE